VLGARAVAPHGLKIEIEVRNAEELRQALAAQADGVLLDNFTPDQVRAAVAEIRKGGTKVFVEVSGGLTTDNVAGYVVEGVDVISSGGITHSPKAIDLSLLVE
jgi:nicotinate-nucleotide pyrophosphorylase (carboxylating)